MNVAKNIQHFCNIRIIYSVALNDLSYMYKRHRYLCNNGIMWIRRMLHANRETITK